MAKKFNIHDWQAKQRSFKINEAHGLDKEDVNTLKDFLKNHLSKEKDSKIYKILQFVINSNIEVDQTKDLSKNEASATGTGASFTAGSGEGYMSPNAFGDNKRKKKKNIHGI